MFLIVPFFFLVGVINKVYKLEKTNEKFEKLFEKLNNCQKTGIHTETNETLEFFWRKELKMN